MIAWRCAALALTGQDGRAIVPPSAFARSEADTDGRGWGGWPSEVVMGDDAATVEQLRAELRQLRERHTEAQAVIASLRGEKTDLADEVQRLRPALSDALERQAATSEVLSVIASSR